MTVALTPDDFAILDSMWLFKPPIGALFLDGSSFIELFNLPPPALSAEQLCERLAALIRAGLVDVEQVRDRHSRALVGLTPARGAVWEQHFEVDIDRFILDETELFESGISHITHRCCSSGQLRQLQAFAMSLRDATLDVGEIGERADADFIYWKVPRPAFGFEIVSRDPNWCDSKLHHALFERKCELHRGWRRTR